MTAERYSGPLGGLPPATIIDMGEVTAPPLPGSRLAAEEAQMEDAWGQNLDMQRAGHRQPLPAIDALKPQ